MSMIKIMFVVLFEKIYFYCIAAGKNIHCHQPYGEVYSLLCVTLHDYRLPVTIVIALIFW